MVLVNSVYMIFFYNALKKEKETEEAHVFCVFMFSVFLHENVSWVA